MSIARKRAKVKRKSPAAKKKKKAARKGKSPTKAAKKKKKKRPAQGTKKRRTTHIGKKIAVSVNTKPPRPTRKRVKRKARKKRRKLTPEQLDRLIQRTISKAAKAAGVSELEVKVRLRGGTEAEVKEAAFFAQPAVQRQVTERLIEKGLMNLTRGMVRTVESIMLTELILAEQRGNLDQRAKELAVEYNWQIQDVYELWFSPETHLES